MKTDDIILRMASKLAETFHPEKIILFGSRASGEASEDSDVDFLIIVRQVTHRRALRVAMRKAVNGMGLSKDIFVLTREEFEIKRKIPGTLAYPADKEGKVLYAA